MIKLVCFFILLSVSNVFVEFYMCRQLISKVMSWYIVTSRCRWRPFWKMAAKCWCSAELPADKWILVGDHPGYKAHIVCLPPPQGATWSTDGWRSTRHDYTIGTLDVLQAYDACSDMGMTYAVIVQCTDCVVFPTFYQDTKFATD